MNEEYLRQLAGIKSETELQRAIETICLAFGGIRDCRLVLDKKNASYFCFVEPALPGACSAIMKQLGGTYFGNGLVFRIPTDP